MPNYPEVNLYIAGEWRKTVDTMPVTNPADDAVIGRVACADRTDLEDAVKAAVSGFEVWRAGDVHRFGFRGQGAGQPCGAAHEACHIGALSLSGPITRFNPEAVARMSPLLLAAAKRASECFGGRLSDAAPATFEN